MEDAIRLLALGDLRGIVDIDTNIVAYSFAQLATSIKKIKPKQLVYAHFNTPELKQKYENGIVLSQSPFIEKNIVKEPNNRLHFLTIYKFYNPETKSFEPLAGELEALSWLAKSYFQDLDISIESSNSNGAFSRLSNSDNTCILNVTKNEKRQQVATYSTPSIIYLNKFLYMKKDNGLSAVLTKLEKPIVLSQLFEARPTTLVGYWKRSDAELADLFISDFQQEYNFVNLAFSNANQLINFDVFKQLKYLDKGRVDFIFEYPSIFKEASARANLKNDLIALPVASSRDNQAAYVACSKSDLGARFIEQLNSLLEQQSFRRQLIRKMNPNYQDSEYDQSMLILDQRYN